MTRRNLIKWILFFGGSTALSFYFVKPLRFILTPDIEELEKARSLIDELAETIIPKTESPGAREASVGGFVLLAVKNCLDRKSQNNFISGFFDLQEYCKRLPGGSFQHCSTSEKINILNHFASKEIDHNGLPGKIKVRLLGHGFIAILKRYTAIGYCYSEQGATQGLRYDFIPGAYMGRTELRLDQTGWATR